MAFVRVARFLRSFSWFTSKRRRSGMAHGMTRRQFAIAASATSLAAFGFGGRARGADLKTLRLIMRNDLRVLDPMWTTAYATRTHAYTVCDTLFALKSKFQTHPQRVRGYGLSPDRLAYCV